MDRRGFLRGILAAAAAPAIVRAGSLMRINPTLVPPPPLAPLFTCEIGEISGFRFIESRAIPKNLGDTIRFRRYNPFPRHPWFTVAALNEGWERMRDEEERPAVPPVLIVHPSWAEDLRAQGVPVESPPE